MRHCLRFPCALLVFMGVGCAPVTGLLERPTSLGIRVPVTRSDARDEFTAMLEPRATVGTLLPRVQPSGSLKLNWRNGDILEYDLKLSDCEGIHFTTAQIVRRSPDGASEIVATLFSDMLLTGPHVQMRGTGSVARGIHPGSLAADIQDQPGAFLVRVASQADDTVVLEGVLR